MTDHKPSNTALGVAWLHAAHQVLDPPPHIVDDAVVGRLIGASPDVILAHGERLQSPGTRALRAHVVTRTRYAEDRLALAANRGTEQYVVLGAGFDTFAYRQPAWARAIRVFEVDQPATQAAKRERVAAAGIQVPSNLTYLAVDFESEALAAALERGGVQFDAPVVVAWLGVTMYLTVPAITAVLRTVADFPRGSEIVFTFAQPPTSAEPDPTTRLADQAAEMGEPWLTRLAPEEVARISVDAGLSRVTFLRPAEIAERFLGAGANGLPVPRRTSIATASRD